MGGLANPATPILQFSDSDIPQLPTRLRQGDSWNWECSFDSYESSTYTLSFIFNSPTARFAFPSGAITADAQGDGFLVQLTATQTESCAAGTYQAVAVLTGIVGGPANGQQVTIPIQDIVIDPNLAGATGGVDTRSYVKKTLDMIEAAILGDTRPDVQEYLVRFEGAERMIRKLDKMTLEKMREKYKGEYRAERRDAGEYAPRPIIGFRFTPNGR